MLRTFLGSHPKAKVDAFSKDAQSFETPQLDGLLFHLQVRRQENSTIVERYETA